MRMAAMRVLGKSAPFTALVGLVLIFAANSAFADATTATTSPLIASSTTVSDFSNPVSSSTPLMADASTTPASTGPALICTSAYTADLYNTPSGHAAPNAEIIGTQSWLDCKDWQGTQYEFKISSEEYASLGSRSARMPREFATSSAELNQPITNQPVANSYEQTASSTDENSITADSTSITENTESATSTNDTDVTPQTIATSTPVTMSTTTPAIFQSENDDMNVSSTTIESATTTSS